MERPTCATCPFWDFDGNSFSEWYKEHYPDKAHDRRRWGACLRYPKQHVGQGVWRYAPQAEDESCGEHPIFSAYVAVEMKAMPPTGSGS